MTKLTKEKVKTKLTKQEIEEIKDNADSVCWYAENVFKYKKDGQWTLIQITDLKEGGEILVEYADMIEWYAEATFKYEKIGKETLIQDGKVLIGGADEIIWDIGNGFVYFMYEEWGYIKNEVKND